MLSVLTVESLNPAVHSIVELASEENVAHCERAGADEIIVGAEFSSRVISTAALDHGISAVLRELLSAQIGHDLITVPVPEQFAGRTFFDLFSGLKRERGMIALAILPRAGGAVVTNPDADAVVTSGDRLVVVADAATGPRTAGRVSAARGRSIGRAPGPQTTVGSGRRARAAARGMTGPHGPPGGATGCLKISIG